MDAARDASGRERTPPRRGTTPGRLYQGREILPRGDKLQFRDDGSVRCLACGRHYDGNAQCSCRREEHEMQSPLFRAQSPAEDLRPVARGLWRRTCKNLFGASPLCNSPGEVERLRAGAARCSGARGAAGSVGPPAMDVCTAPGTHPAVLFAANVIPAGWRAATAGVVQPAATDRGAAISPTQRWSA